MKRTRVNKSLCLVVLAFILLCSCSKRHKADVLPPSKLESVLYDYHLAQVIVGDLPSGQRYKKDLYFDYVYNKHHVTKAEVDSSLIYYARHPKGLSEVYDNLSKRIKADIQRLGNEDQPITTRSSRSVIGDSANLWYDLDYVEMNISPLQGNHYTFSIPTDTNFKKLDRIVWSGEVLFLDNTVDSLHKYLHLNLRVAYMNGSISSADTLLYHSGIFSLEVCDSAVVKSIRGTAYLKSRDASERLLILAPTLMRFRHRADSLVVTDSSIVKQQVKEMNKSAKFMVDNFEEASDRLEL